MKIQESQSENMVTTASEFIQIQHQNPTKSPLSLTNFFISWQTLRPLTKMISDKILISNLILNLKRSR